MYCVNANPQLFGNLFKEKYESCKNRNEYLELIKTKKIRNKNNFKYDFVACHHGREGLEELRDLLKRTGYLESTMKFFSDSNELLKVHGNYFLWRICLFCNPSDCLENRLAVRGMLASER